MIRLKNKKKFKKTMSFLNALQENSKRLDYDVYGQYGVELLSKTTPIDTGRTASSWDYTIVKNTNTTTISFFNTNIQNGTIVALVLDSGHVGMQGTWIEGANYIRPAIETLVDKINTDIRRGAET